MLSAQQAAKHSSKGARETKRRKHEEEERKSAEWVKQQRAENPGKIKRAESAVTSATARGEREADTGLRFMCGEDYHDGIIPIREQLVLPHQELLAHFEQAGYTVELRYDMESYGPSWYEIYLKW